MKSKTQLWQEKKKTVLQFLIKRFELISPLASVIIIRRRRRQRPPTVITIVVVLSIKTHIKIERIVIIIKDPKECQCRGQGHGHVHDRD
jgi:hypothetical protein